MRNLHCVTIQIASASGERRYINVSGLAKAQLLWLFRNFSILDFSVLTTKQQEIVAQIWYAGRSAGAKSAEMDLIGTVEGFTPQRYEAVRWNLPSLAESKPGTTIEDSSVASQRHLSLRLAMAAILLLVSALALKLGHVKPHLFVSAADRSGVEVPVRASSPPDAPGKTPEPAVEVGARPEVTAPVAKASPEAAPAVAAQPTPKVAVRLPMAVASPLLPEAMAKDESLTKVKAPLTSRTLAPKSHAEVLIRVRIDGEGKLQGYEIVQGSDDSIRAALVAVRRWSFQPCSGGAICEHTLRFTDYGDTFRLQSAD